MMPVKPSQLELVPSPPSLEDSFDRAVERVLVKSAAKVEEPPPVKVPDKVEVNPSSEDFDWNTDDSIILREQRATAAYRNRAGELIIRQQAAWDQDEDTFVYISPENEIAFMEGLAKRARD
ncbi:MAG: hypothetical protein QHD01_26240 [Bradyrhizobium sp.]|uniref:hypothetical protein n=1 Tax=Bradyrhizobium sp. TaxID=376 RepID=UPI0029AD4044|nr:hypothetical protein [Bradyrhizobium sp.]MDX3970079.1 hypothetical protein [Bradyrhizobium sp.]